MGRSTKQAEPLRDPAWEPGPKLLARVQSLARRWSRDRPDRWEDLYQEGLLAIWLKGETESPLHHQVYTAQVRMLLVRQQGRSVDGRLYAAFKRPKVWTTVSLDRGHHPPPRESPVEECVMHRITVQEVLALLDPNEAATLALVRQGFKHREIAARLGQHPRAPYRTMKGVKEKVRPYFYDGAAKGE